VQLQPTYGDKPYWSSRVYANINGLWQMAESYHTYIKDAPVMAPVPRVVYKEERDQLIMKHVVWFVVASVAAASVVIEAQGRGGTATRPDECPS
jgi:hypothetical protein